MEPALCAAHRSFPHARRGHARPQPCRAARNAEKAISGPAIPAAIQRNAPGMSLRERLKERGQALAQGQEQIELALANSDGKGIGDALATADPTAVSVRRSTGASTPRR